MIRITVSSDSENAVAQTIPAITVVDYSRKEDASEWLLRPDGLDALAERTPKQWDIPESASGLLQSVVSDARGSNVYLGESPETWSPLGSADDLSAVARWESTHELEREYFGPRSPESTNSDADIEFGGELSNGHRMVSMRLGANVIGAFAFLSEAFIVSIPSGTLDIKVANREWKERNTDEVEMIRAQLNAILPGVAIRYSLAWRIYVGSNTRVLDGTSSRSEHAFTIRHDGAEGLAVLVGRIFLSANVLLNRDRPDPTARSRLDRHSWADRPTAGGCPSLLDQTAHVHDGVIAIHGTMACGIPLAKVLRTAVDDEIPVFRFEHDTWLPIGQNAKELAEHIRRLKLRRVVLVSHSRGGLVARDTVKRLRNEGIEFQLISLGTPYEGTPIVDLAQGGLLTTFAIMGALKVLHNPLVDVATRLAGFLIKVKLPRGIESMRPCAEYLSGFAGESVARLDAFAGRADRSGISNSYGVDFSRGFATAAFPDGGNDYVVSIDSALVAAGGAQVELQTDHFSYLDQKMVVDRLAKIRF
ncbi:MAG TPA: hypothetical protein VGM94_16850 [Galbitalea sp.]|jgi:hypothetical protein